MTAAELIDVMRAARKLGAVRLEVRDAGVSVDFAELPKAKRSGKAAAGAQVEMPDPIVRTPKLTEEQLEQLRDAILDQYIPGH
jgi:hypothetical protein